jgi:hypothetical protein
VGADQECGGAETRAAVARNRARRADQASRVRGEAGDARDEVRVVLEEERGGGIVVIHSAAVAKDHDWWKSIIGGSWVFGTTKWKEGPMDLYFTENQRLDYGHPITKDASNFHMDDEIYYDMDISPDVRVLATGDSHAFGVCDTDETPPSKLEQLLAPTSCR